MKNQIVLLMITFCSCSSKEINLLPRYEEKKLSFEVIQNGYHTSNQWIKEPKNIEMIHETFKLIGYNKILNELNWITDGIRQLDNSRSLQNLIDSLHLSYKNTENNSTYYRQFWNRRSKEGNDKIVFKVISEIKSISNEKEKISSINTKLINDTLRYLCEIELKDSLTTTEANSFLNYLISSGLHQSAYHVRSGENTKFDEIQWNQEPEKTYKKLNISSTFQKPWIMDNSK